MSILDTGVEYPVLQSKEEALRLCYSIIWSWQVIKKCKYFSPQRLNSCFMSWKWPWTAPFSTAQCVICSWLLSMVWTTQYQKLHLTFSSQATIRSTIKHIFALFWPPWEAHIIISSSLASGKNAQWPGNLLFSVVYYMNLKQKKSPVNFLETSMILWLDYKIKYVLLACLNIQLYSPWKG